MQDVGNAFTSLMPLLADLDSGLLNQMRRFNSFQGRMVTLKEEYSATCPGCGTGTNHYHSEFCDTARCAKTGIQLISCEFFSEYEYAHVCENTTWTGYWPGVLDCFEYGLFAYFVPNVGFIPCTSDHPDAVCDLNTLVVKYDWDVKLQKRVPRNA